MELSDNITIIEMPGKEPIETMATSENFDQRLEDFYTPPPTGGLYWLATGLCFLVAGIFICWSIYRWLKKKEKHHGSNL